MYICVCRYPREHLPFAHVTARILRSTTQQHLGGKKHKQHSALDQSDWDQIAVERQAKSSLPHAHAQGNQTAKHAFMSCPW